MKYAIKVEEISSRTVIVEADNLDEAVEKVEQACEDNRIILDYDDFNERNVEVSSYFKDGIVSDEKDVSYYWHLTEQPEEEKEY